MTVGVSGLARSGEGRGSRSSGSRGDFPAQPPWASDVEDAGCALDEKVEAYMDDVRDERPMLGRPSQAERQTESSQWYAGEQMPVTKKSKGKARGSGKGHGRDAKRHRPLEPPKHHGQGFPSPNGKKPRPDYVERRPLCQGCMESHVSRRGERHCAMQVKLCGAVLCVRCSAGEGSTRCVVRAMMLLIPEAQSKPSRRRAKAPWDS